MGDPCSRSAVPLVAFWVSEAEEKSAVFICNYVMTWNFCEFFLFLINTSDTRDETGYHQHGLCENGERKFTLYFQNMRSPFFFFFNTHEIGPIQCRRELVMLGTQARRDPCALCGCWPSEASVQSYTSAQTVTGTHREAAASSYKLSWVSKRTTLKRHGRRGAVAERGASGFWAEMSWERCALRFPTWINDKKVYLHHATLFPPVHPCDQMTQMMKGASYVFLMSPVIR